MKVIQPNCRIQFTAEDIDFIVRNLGDEGGKGDALVRLLTDEDARDEILDDEVLFRALLEHRGCLRVSHRFYFYVLVRHVLRQGGINDRSVADYVAEVLAEFSHSERARCVVPGHRQPLDYMVDMLAALQTADDRTRFCIHAHIGNHSLFVSGIFAERIRTRAASRGFPGVRYYEDLGRANYRFASDHRLARRYDLSSIFTTLSDHFEATREALNELTDRLIFLGESDAACTALMRIDAGGN
jgi:hypothetical protein